MIYKITVFKAYQPVTGDEFPNIIFWVKDVPVSYWKRGRGGQEEVKSGMGLDTGIVGPIGGIREGNGEQMVVRSTDGKSVRREHVVCVES